MPRFALYFCFQKVNSIYWNVYGKIASIKKQDTTIFYGYDASGNRISKTVTKPGSSLTTWYVRDASGNVMSVYTRGDNSQNGGQLTQTETHLYGSSRIGLFKPNNNVENPPVKSQFPLAGGVGYAYFQNFERGRKIYELSNHLGNVLTTVSDRRIALDADQNGIVDYYQADILSQQDYYPFGMIMQARSFSSSRYRYGFNGQEKDTTIEPNHFTALYWEYDSRSGRRWNIDPKADQKISLSPYNALSNNPNSRIDADGDLDDWVQNSKGEIYWDKNATSKATTKIGENYLGKNLKFIFNSYIDNNLWDGPLGSFPSGDKLTSTINLYSHADAENNLLAVDIVSSKPVVHKTGGIFQGANYFPGEKNIPINIKGVTNAIATYEQHAKVNRFEEAGLGAMGYDAVNVAQRITFRVNNNKLSISAATDIFPSASLSVNDVQLFKYDQPSFKATHKILKDYTNESMKYSTHPVPTLIHLRPLPAFYNRYEKD